MEKKKDVWRMRCERCGNPLPVGWETKPYCMNCEIEVKRNKAAQMREKAAIAREQKAKGRPPEPGNIGEYPGKHRCETCGHSYRMDCTPLRACFYLTDKETYELPPRPRPSADPNHCIYWSPSPATAGWFTEVEKRVMYDERLKPVLDMEHCKVYKSVGTASSLVGVSHTSIKRECEMTDDINASRRWRYLKPEEIELIKPRKG